MKIRTHRLDADTTHGHKLRNRIVGGGLAALIGLGSLTTMAPHASAETMPAASTVAPPGRMTAGLDPVDELAKGILSKIGGKGTDLLLNQIGLGDATDAKLDQIRKDLEALHNEVQQMRTQITADNAKDHYGQYVHELDDVTGGIGETVPYLIRVGDQQVVVRDRQRALDHAATPEARDAAQKELTDARATYSERVDQFQRFFERANVDRSIGRLNKMLDGPLGADDVVQAYRRVVRTTNRYVSRASSEAVYAVYTTLENFQVTAALMTAEYNASHAIANEDLAATIKRDIDQQRSKLPAMIPAGVVIDLGVNPTSTQNKPVYLSVAGSYTFDPSGKAHNGVTAKIDELNAQKPNGFGGWKVPSAADLDAMFAGSSKAPADRLTELGLANAPITAWTAAIVSQHSSALSLNRPFHFNVDTHVFYGFGGGTVTKTASPTIPSSFGLGQSSTKILADLFDNARAGLIAEGNTGTTNYL